MFIPDSRVFNTHNKMVQNFRFLYKSEWKPTLFLKTFLFKLNYRKIVTETVFVLVHRSNRTRPVDDSP